MVSLGIKGLFELVKETWKKYPELCKKALQAFFDLLQGLDPEELNDEPAEVVGEWRLQGFHWNSAYIHTYTSV